MSNEPIDTQVTSADTDDLEAFTDLFNGKTAEAPVKEAEVKEDVETEEVNPVEETDEDSDPQDDNPDEEEAPKEEEKPKKANRFQERINELTAKAREAERREAELQRRIDELAVKQAEPTKPAETLKQNPVSLPDPNALNEDGTDKYPLGEFDPTYIRDLNRVIIEEEMAAAKSKEIQLQTEREVQASRDALHNSWVEKLTPITEQYDDFLDKTLELETAFDGLDPNYSDYLVQTIKSLDHGPEVLYYFANNLDAAKDFVSKGPLQATLVLGEINALFKREGKKETKVSNAPPPPQLNKGTNLRRTVTPDTEDLDAFENIFFKKK